MFFLAGISSNIRRVGQNHKYTEYRRCSSWQGFHQIYVGLARTINIRSTDGVLLGRDFIKYTKGWPEPRTINIRCTDGVLLGRDFIKQKPYTYDYTHTHTHTHTHTQTTEYMYKSICMNLNGHAQGKS